MLHRIIIISTVAFGLCCANVYGQQPQADPRQSLNDFFNSLRTLGKRPAQPANGKSISAHSKTIDAMGLRDILPEFDPDKSNSEQFPHIAITVLQSPPMWLAPQTAASGCWKLKAVVWSDAHKSRIVGPFDWCFPQDKEITIGPGAPLPSATITDKFDYLTGISRTQGPRPPGTIIPDDRKMHELEQKNSNDGRALSIQSLYSLSSFGTMFSNMRHELGANIATDHDFRVWVVNVEQ